MRVFSHHSRSRFTPTRETFTVRKRWIFATAAALSITAVSAGAAVMASGAHLADQDGVTVGDGAQGSGAAVVVPEKVKDSSALDDDGPPVVSDSDGEQRTDPATPPSPISVDSPQSPASLD